MELGRINKGQEERRSDALVAGHERLFVEGRVRQRQAARRPALQRQGPVQHHLQRRTEIGHLNPVEHGERRQVVAQESIQAAIDWPGRPRFGHRAVAGVDEIARLEAAPARFPGVRDARREGAPPELHMGVDLLMDLRAALGVIEPRVDLERELAPLVRRRVVAPDRSDRDRVGHAAVCRVLRQAMLERQAHQRCRDEARGTWLAPDVGRRPHQRQHAHDGANGDVGHHGQVDERGDRSIAAQPLNCLDLRVHDRIGVFVSCGKGDLKEREPVARAGNSVAVTGLVLVQHDPQAVHLGLVEGRRRAGQQHLEILLRRLETAGEILGLGRFEPQREHQLVLGAPRIIREKRHPVFEVGRRGTIGGRGLGLPARRQVQPRGRDPLGIARQQRASDVEVADDFE